MSFTTLNERRWPFSAPAWQHRQLNSRPQHKFPHLPLIIFSEVDEIRNPAKRCKFKEQTEIAEVAAEQIKKIEAIHTPSKSTNRIRALWNPKVATVKTPQHQGSKPQHLGELAALKFRCLQVPSPILLNSGSLPPALPCSEGRVGNDPGMP